MTPMLKICGITDTETLVEMAAEALSPDQLGFVFAESRRRIESVQWERLSWLIPETTKTAGVFVNPSIADITTVFKAASLDIVQLHGEETPAFCREIRERFGCAVTKTFSIQTQEGHSIRPEQAAYSGNIDYILLDTASGEQRGGTGKTFDWGCIASYLAWSRAQGIPLLVAGGINADNVSDLLMHYNPDGVDISSGAETNGKKDIAKMRKIIERMKMYEQSTVE